VRFTFPAVLLVTSFFVVDWNEKGPDTEKWDCDCEVDFQTRVATSAKGFNFRYQSGCGHDCRAYRVQNLPGGNVIPIRWYDKDYVHMDHKLPPYGAGGDEWFTKYYESRRQRIGLTTLSYGLLKEQRIEHGIRAIREVIYDDNYEDWEQPGDTRRSGRAGEPDWRGPRPFRTCFKGAVAGEGDGVYKVNISLESKLLPSPRSPTDVVLEYDIKGEINGVGFGLNDDRMTSPFNLVWESPSSVAFSEALEGSGHYFAPNEGKKITVTTARFKVQRGLVKVLKGEGKEVLLRSTAPAYQAVQDSVDSR
jgi:hypothetical protein